MYKFWCDYMKGKYEKHNIMLHGYRQLYSLHKTEDVETRLDT